MTRAAGSARHALAGGGLRALGLLPVQFIALIDPVTRQLTGTGLGPPAAAGGLAGSG